jgi:hypothetical protein
MRASPEGVAGDAAARDAAAAAAAAVDVECGSEARRPPPIPGIWSPAGGSGETGGLPCFDAIVVASPGSVCVLVPLRATPAPQPRVALAKEEEVDDDEEEEKDEDEAPKSLAS